MMGIESFDSTKGKKVPGADLSGTDVRRKPRAFRQIMNRKRGCGDIAG
jgi:U4/U6.U5 tri-snRNP-associated protein 3